ncbi:ShlB/FhaC/HecB family hemolysin secretion/activation protein [Anaerosinus massiliensis]|uniref:ShlB/FhaC/HecB family hemolysin secretion/activation protein n=1 Tax=Massilibacillus massiliensis TaxID=1806837 RepID=UPI000AA2D2AD|nr:ShlB/FhaC/HecB family hemolysin secretion/activation protein [Massilibacillus massiliensis]
MSYLKIFCTKRSTSFIVSILILFVNTQLVQAAPSPPDPIVQKGSSLHDKEQQKQKARETEQERLFNQQKPDVFLQKEHDKQTTLTLPEETPSFLIQNIVLEGQSTDQFPWTKHVLAPYIGQKIGWQGINLIVKQLTENFVDRGFVTTRVLIPQQNLSQGTLTLTLVPGIIQDIRFAQGSAQTNWHNAFPARPGQILNLRDLEQGLEQMKRVPSQDVEMELVPGEKEGESIVVLSLKKTKPWKTILSLDDSGSQATGRLQTSGTFSYDNLFGSNDLFNLSYNFDADREQNSHGTRGNSIYYSIPQGYWTYTFSGSSYRYHQTVPLENDAFRFSGKSTKFEFNVDRLIYRDQNSKTTLGLGLTKSHSKSYIEDTELEGQRRDMTAAQISLTQKQYIGQNVLDYTVGYKRGVPWFGAQEYFKEADLPTSRYQLWTLDANLTVPLQFGSRKGQYTGILHGQYTQDTLYASEFLSIGNRYTVRGFDGETTLSAENGWYLQNEFSIALDDANQLYIGLDYGQISGATANQNAGKKLAGAVLGLRGKLDASRTQYDLFVGTALKKPKHMEAKGAVIGFQLIYQM